MIQKMVAKCVLLKKWAKTYFQIVGIQDAVFERAKQKRSNCFQIVDPKKSCREANLKASELQYQSVVLLLLVENMVASLLCILLASAKVHYQSTSRLI